MSKQNNLNKKQICKNIIGIIILIAVYFAGYFTAKFCLYNKQIYHYPSKLSFEESLEIKSLEPYNMAYFEQAQSQADLNMTSANRYDHYHKYYKRVVSRIKKYDFEDDKVKKAIVSYIDNYENRKADMDKVLFPHTNEAQYYGTVFGCLYPKAMLEFDRQELLTYKMILEYMYTPLSEQDIEKIFAE